MSAKAPFRLLDITRLVARAGGRPLTGIDRVERAYLAALIARQDPFALICRTAAGVLILGSDTAPKLLAWVDDTGTIPRASLLGRTLARSHCTPGLEAALRPLALARLRCARMADWLATWLPMGIRYLNVGHTNLTGQTLGQLRRVPGLTVAVMIHDTIPLDYPEYSAARAPAEFREKLSAVVRHANLILCTSAAVEADVRRWAGIFGAIPLTRIAHLGVEVVAPDSALVPLTFDLTRPYFVALGTIEPRKDHALLLDVWARFHVTLPQDETPWLFILGRRGWKNDTVFSRLDAAPFIGKTVIEAADLADGGVAAILPGACGFLAPSRAEGYGLPAAEAASLGVPVLATDLPVTREILGAYPIYAPAGDMYAWANMIRILALRAKSPRLRPIPAKVPDWAGHFNLVFKWV